MEEEVSRLSQPPHSFGPPSCLPFSFFCVVQHQRDEQILYALKKLWGFGVVRKNHGDRLCYRVRGINNLNKTIIPFFEKHSLKTKKKIDFLKFRKVLQLIEKKQHLTIQGLLEIDAIRLEMNTGKAKKKLILIDGKLDLIDI